MSGIMAVHLGIISLTLWGLLQHTTWACSVSCSTDYISSLNCTCADQVPAYPYAFVATCWEEDDHVNSSCEIVAPKQWCILELDSREVISADTQCTIRGMSAEDKWTTEENNTVHIILQKHIKPQPPFNLTLTENENNFTVSWEMAYTPVLNYYLNNFLIYRVRIRAKDDSEKDPGKQFTIREDRRYLEVLHSSLEHGKTYVVDVQARPSVHFSTSGYWSEWSPAVEVHIKYLGDEAPNWNDQQGEQNYWSYISLVLGLVTCTVVFCCGRKIWLHKAHLCSYIPSPEGYFKPLYCMHGGDFTKWVGPAFVFGEFDFLEKNMVLPVVNVKQSNLIPKCETESWENGAACSKGDKSLDSSFLGMLSPQGQSFLDSNSGSQATESSRGGISIDTVTVLEEGEEEAEEEGGSGQGGSWHSYRGIFAYPSFRVGENPGGEGKALLGADPKREAVISGGRMTDGEGIPGGRPAPLGLYDLEWSLANRASELERLSLDSFGSGERSEDGYPNVVLDLDTIDSGFLESDCSSPVRSDFGDKDEEAEEQQSHSNYVKQWVTRASEPDARTEACNGSSAGAHAHPHTHSVQS
ncbi:interleukin-21 receptor-like [Scleropages formosus]|uniref:Interleukin-21 receptor-like n=1 Tax=Scleropages formosus TaxID=113540 RepID=A0A8C9S0F7_SCLFO|nr:interleukin-21 receptor-like [Scleropages formosus]XP_018590417.1 interleukin-21 receptor-like [Scleropages formosus]